MADRSPDAVAALHEAVRALRMLKNEYADHVAKSTATGKLESRAQFCAVAEAAGIVRRLADAPDPLAEAREAAKLLIGTWSGSYQSLQHARAVCRALGVDPEQP